MKNTLMKTPKEPYKLFRRWALQGDDSNSQH